MGKGFCRLERIFIIFETQVQRSIHPENKSRYNSARNKIDYRCDPKVKRVCFVGFFFREGCESSWAASVGGAVVWSPGVQALVDGIGPVMARREDCPETNSFGGLDTFVGGNEGNAAELGAGGLLSDRAGRCWLGIELVAADFDQGVVPG